MSEEEIKECLDSLYYQDDVCSISYDKLKDYIIKLKTKLQQKENIIKEAKEYVEEKEKDDDNWIDYELLIEPIRIKEILDKENKE